MSNEQMTYEILEARLLILEHDFAEAVDLAEEAIPYVSEYLADKWDMPNRLAALKAKIDPESEAYKAFWLTEADQQGVADFIAQWVERHPHPQPE